MTIDNLAIKRDALDLSKWHVKNYVEKQSVFENNEIVFTADLMFGELLYATVSNDGRGDPDEYDFKTVPEELEGLLDDAVGEFRKSAASYDHGLAYRYLTEHFFFDWILRYQHKGFTPAEYLRLYFSKESS